MFISPTAKASTSLRPESSAIAPEDWNILAAFWYPIAVSQDLKSDAPMRAKLLDVDLVLYRGKGGEVAVAIDICPHRHVRLSAGKVIDGQIECPFHGLRFDATGRCQRVPALGREVRLPESYRVRSFPARERYGLIWTCFGNADKDTIPDFPPFNDIDPAQIGIVEGLWPISAARQVENFTDLAHLPLVHATTLGGDPDAAIKPARIEQGEAELTCRALYVETDDSGQPTPHELTYRIVLPFNVQFKSQRISDPNHVFEACDLASPVTAHSCRVFQIVKSPEGQAAFETMKPALVAVNDQDIAVLQTMVIPDLPLDMRREIHLPVDNVSSAYREGLRDLGLGGAQTTA